MDYTDHDKVSLNQLNPNLQQMLSNLITSQAFKELMSSLDVHKSDNKRHLTEEAINKIEYSYRRIKETIDEDVGQMLLDFSNTVLTIQQHMNNDTIHWTAVEKAEYKNILNTVRNAISQMQSSIAKYQLDTSTNYVGFEQYQALDDNVQNHIANNNCHIFSLERVKWNNMINDANSYSDQILQGHKQDRIQHTSENEKKLWNDHVNNNAIHMYVTDVALIQNHMQDNTKHTTLEEKNIIKQLQAQVTTLTEQVSSLQNIVQSQQSLLDRIQRSISIIEN